VQFASRKELAVALWRECRDDRVTGLAAEIAFYAVFSVFPGLIVLTAGVGTLLDSELADEAERVIIEGLSGVLTDQAGGLVGEVRSLFAERRGGTFTFALLFALWGLSRGFAAVIRALDIAYGVPERRTYLQQRLLAVVLAVASAVLAVVMLAMLVVGPLLGLGDWIDQADLSSLYDLAWTWARWPVMVVLLILWAATLYHVAPNHRTPWRADLPGAVVAAALWLLVSVGLSVYLRIAALGNAVLGTLGGGLVLLIWLYLLGLVLLVGGEVNAVLLGKRGSEDPGQGQGSEDPGQGQAR
jgi:membrane protein